MKDCFDPKVIERRAKELEGEYRFQEAVEQFLSVAEHYRKTDPDKAADLYFQAARCFEKTELPRVIPSFWRMAGDLLGKSPKATVSWRSRELDTQNQLYSVITGHQWNNPDGFYESDSKNLRTHRQAWTYQWAAQRCEFYGNHQEAMKLFRRAAWTWKHAANQKQHLWKDVGQCFARACLNQAVYNGTLSAKYNLWDESIGLERGEQNIVNDDKDDIEEMKSAYDKALKPGKDKATYYRTMQHHYRQIHAPLMSFGNQQDADKIYREIMVLRQREHWSQKRWHKWLWLFLTSIISNYGLSFWRWLRVVAFVFGLLFPYIYHKYQLVVSSDSGGFVDFGECIYFSVLTAATLSYGDYEPASGLGQAVAMLEVGTGLLFVGLVIHMFTRTLTQEAKR